MPYPHPYLDLWLLCRAHPGPNGEPALPEPERGPTNQDADLMLGFEVLEAGAAHLAEEEERRKEVRRLAHEQLGGGGGMPLT